jgi:subtilisin family serine protease
MTRIRIPLVVAIIISFPIFLFAQKPNWQNLDLQTDSVCGISTEKAYQQLLNKKHKKKIKPVLVAVIDAGIDTNHEDLKEVIWTNPKEIAGNNVDDDHNGYTDDVHGWNFIGSSKGNVNHENLELVRLIKKLQPVYGNMTDSSVTEKNRAGYESYKNMVQEYTTEYQKAKGNLTSIRMFDQILNGITSRIGKDNPSLQDFRDYKPQNENEERIVRIIESILEKNSDFKEFKTEQIDEGLKYYTAQVDYQLNFDYNARLIVGDDSTNDNEHYYGNADVTGPDADHGTHVAGIIGAVRNNNIGIKGVADHVWLLSVRTVPDGDERDKDVANAIRYAADNGAKVVNMSFGKAYSWDKKVVDDAVKYAMSKDVLLVVAAGNESKDVDKENNFPNRKYEDGSGVAGAWIEVGASGWKNDETLAASFSNYGKTNVDVFAPGESIYSTVPGNKYANHDGTSMATPVVTGLAALIRTYYPKLTALQVKDIILRSVVKVNHTVRIKVGEEEREVPFSEICVSGGIVNAYNALELAKKYK